MKAACRIAVLVLLSLPNACAWVLLRAAPYNAARPGLRMCAPDHTLTSEEDLRRQRRAWALIFNHRTDNEGIYSQQRGVTDYVFCWETKEDAARFGDMLVAQDFPEGSAVEMDMPVLLDFCQAPATPAS